MTTNGYFGPGLFRFLRDLKTHNERRWFEANKQRYKADVQEPFLRLITDGGFNRLMQHLDSQGRAEGVAYEAADEDLLHRGG